MHMLTKLLIPIFASIIFNQAGIASFEKHAVEGVWLVAEGNSKIFIAACDGKFCGRIQWKKDGNNNGKIGTMILKDFSATDEKTLDGGKIFDPGKGKWYNGRLRIDKDGKLEVRGWVGMPAMGKSVYWTRSK